jgi:hypothetical protein
MNTKIDIKSAGLGLGIGILVMLGVAATSSRDANGGNHGLVIDTATGQVWTGYFSSTEGNTDADFLRAKIDDKK